jgi:hypothetical protein
MVVRIVTAPGRRGGGNNPGRGLITGAISGITIGRINRSRS